MSESKGPGRAGEMTSRFNAEETRTQEQGGEESDSTQQSRHLKSLTSAKNAQRFLLILGAFFVVFAATYPFVPIVEDASLQLWVVLGVLVGGPGVVLVVGGYRLPRTDVRREYYTVVSKWCLRGIALTLGISAIIVLASSNTQAVENTLLLTALGSLAGFAAGSYDARAKTRHLELRETIDQLRTSNERLEQFAYAASHDLQEPLRMVSSYLQLLETRYRDDLDDEAHEFIDFAVDGADRMRAMVDSLLDYSRVSTRGNPLEPTEAGEVLQDVREDLRKRIEATDADIAAEELPTVNADHKQLAQVFHHLLKNAIEFSGGEPPKVRIRAERAGDMWRFTVTDEGIGVDPEYHERIFEIFEKVHPGTEGPEIGSGGVGLALCKRILERHGGEIWVESEPGDGTTFSFTMPIVDGS